MPRFSDKVVFVLDDEPRVLHAIAESVRSICADVKEFSTAEQCLAALKSATCNLLISDVNMPGMDGLALLAVVKQMYPLLPIVMISGVGDIPMAVNAVKNGATDFVEKPIDESTFLPIIEQILSQTDETSTVDLSALTPAEKKVLQLVAEGKSNKEIAQIFNRSLRTVENHRNRLMGKLGAENVADLVKFAIAARLIARV
ncbi:MAG: response regulator [Bdellovibrionota bacterium]